MLKEIQSGEYARKWMSEHDAGRPWFNATRARERTQLLETTGAALRQMMPFVQPVVVTEDGVTQQAAPAAGKH